jgi:hypothetical protein
LLMDGVPFFAAARLVTLALFDLSWFFFRVFVAISLPFPAIAPQSQKRLYSWGSSPDLPPYFQRSAGYAAPIPIEAPSACAVGPKNIGRRSRPSLSFVSL